ncbi:amidohydrolase [Virgibacillus sp. W0430]|uniref:amidohydrolase n=1 Tax=Virgibacillus sp. W0430 TaxID=3391580 RepID=UPI003F4714B5
MKTIYTNGTFYTFDASKPIVEAVVVDNGRFIDVGTADEMLLQWGRTESKVIDLEGRAVTPGLVDSHLHLSKVAISLLNLDLSGVTTKNETLEMIRDYATTLKKDAWLIGRGWDENIYTDGTLPSIEELDRVAPHHPLFITRVCEHASLVNSKALEKIGYTKSMTVPEGGKIVVDEQTKRPTGLLLETASDLVTAQIPNYTYEELKQALRKAMQLALQKGITSVHTNDPKYLGGLDQTYRLYDELLNHEELGLRCNLLIDHEYLPQLKESGMYAGFGNETLQIGAVKIFADGALGRRTAFMSEPYADAPNEYGSPMFDQEMLYEHVRSARALAMPVAVHVIGDQALENTLDVLDEFPAAAYRDRLIHTSVVRKDLIKRLVHPSRIADIQPRFLVSDFPWVEERLGKERIQWVYPWKTYMQLGVLAAGGSDAPIEPINPLLGIHAAVTRRKPGEVYNGYNPEQKLTLEEAFRLFTVMGAYPTNEERIKGTITRGKLADMTVYSTNPFARNEIDELLNIDVDMTIIGGKIR